MLENMRRETERLIIRPFTLDDVPALYEIISDPEVMRYLPDDVTSPDELKELFEWILCCYEKNTPSKLIKLTEAIVWKETGGIIGWCGLGPLDFNPDEIEIFFGLAKEYWNRGIAAEAASEMVRYGFDEIGLYRIVAVANPENIGSVKVIEKLGMKYKGIVGKLPEKHKSYEGHLYYSVTEEGLKWKNKVI
ncbi:MAG: GNAT family N-acetyltransferase [Candidatus Zixiibacteriota bacterium]|nr:MAG: GNAT family N-acetyltransferase [candidate division Zixibacteria bacterium]